MQNRRHRIIRLSCVAVAALFTSVAASLAISQDAIPNKVEARAFDEDITSAFLESSNGWSVDEVLLDDGRRRAFVDACRAQPRLHSDAIPEKDLFERLIQIRKAGRLNVKANKRANSDVDEWLSVAEIASRLMEDRFQANIDQWLVTPHLLAEFDATVEKIVPEADRYASRKAAMKLRKSRRLQPELLTRVTDWKREIQTLTVEYASTHLASLPKNAGIYIFRDKTGFLYIGQSSNLQARLIKHLDKSDRKSLSKYLESSVKEEITIELHVFASDSPAANTVVREAYESDLIRTRKPRLNVAP